MAPATMTEVMRFFEMKPGEFRTEWAELSDTEKAQFKEGIGNGSLTY